jgi:beta-phosphoglucomutase-like phosphatase (HAD superfamily)
MPGAAAQLETLAARGVPICVTSNGPIAKIRQTLRIAGFAHHFADRLFSAYVVGFWKPDLGDLAALLVP